MASSIDNSRLSVMLWGQEIGQLSWNPAKRNSYFFFSKEYLESGLDIAPLTASSKSPAARFAIYGNTDSAKYQKLPPFIADSLPDDWGNTLFDQWFAEHHYHEKDKTPLAKLSFVGSRAMGALEFVPCSEDAFSAYEKLMIPKLYELAKKIEKDRELAMISPEETLTQKALMAVGTSAGGRFKKAIIAMDDDGNIYSDQTSAREDRRYYILKFNTPEFCLSEIEKTWYDLAIKAGITMMPSRLMEVEGTCHFLTERFDRRGGEKIFTQTLAAVNPEAYCYEDLFSTCRQLSISKDELNELYLRMVFNILSGNTDDHAKNFSFIMEKDGSWHLSPAYDLCFILKTATTPEKHHVFSIRGKHEDITISDLLDFAVQNDIKSPVKYIETVKDTLRGFRAFATANGVAPLFIDIIESRLRELSPDVFDPPVATYEVLKAQFARLKRQFQEERKASLNRPATDGELKDLAARFNEGRLF
ncbi:MAG: type II toxin-antitoxin system HipA family toxin [Bacteroidales bacterium]|nr:type II toxin-antitoxin system HipA family toxin [Bacteroidales bacterium]